VLSETQRDEFSKAKQEDEIRVFFQFFSTVQGLYNTFTPDGRGLLMMMLTFRGEKNLKVGDCGDRTLFGAEIPSGDPQRSLRHKTGLEPLYKLFILIASEFITFFLHSLPFITECVL
jgi:hypothetical protein